MPTVSLPLNRATGSHHGSAASALAGAHAQPPHMATRQAAPVIRIADSISLANTLKRNHGQEKNSRRFAVDLSAGCCRVALDLVRASRHRPPIGSSGGLPMRDLITSLKKIGLAAGTGILFGLLAFGHTAEAANPAELNFGLFGPRYDGRVKECEASLGTITSQFEEKESKFWNSALQITAYGRGHETAFRPWQSDNIPRRYCTADVMLKYGKLRTVHYSIIEDGGFAGFGQGVE